MRQTPRCWRPRSPERLETHAFACSPVSLRPLRSRSMSRVELVIGLMGADQQASRAGADSATRYAQPLSEGVQ